MFFFVDVDLKEFKKKSFNGLNFNAVKTKMEMLDSSRPGWFAGYLPA